jgi:hypothetical protein
MWNLGPATGTYAVVRCCFETRCDKHAGFAGRLLRSFPRSSASRSAQKPAFSSLRRASACGDRRHALRATSRRPPSQPRSCRAATNDGRRPRSPARRPLPLRSCASLGSASVCRQIASSGVGRQNLQSAALRAASHPRWLRADGHLLALALAREPFPYEVLRHSALACMPSGVIASALADVT